MTLVTGTVQDLGHAPLDGTLYARPARFLPSGNVVYAPERPPYKIEGGTFSVELAPGPAVLELKVGTHARDEFRVVIPDQETIGLADLIAEVFPWQPEQVSKFVAERELAVQAKKDAETAAGQASTAAGTATTAAQQTGQDRSHVDQVRALLDETYDESQAGMALPPRLTETALSATYALATQVVADGTDKTAQINAALTAVSPYGLRTTVKLVGEFTITAPLVIHSSTRLDCTDATITKATNAHFKMLHNAAMFGTGARDHDIEVFGGFWERPDTVPGATVTTEPNDAHSILFHRADRVKVTDLRFVGDGPIKYFVYGVDVNHFTTERLDITSTSDGVHITGPSSDVTIRDISGDTHDDLVSFTGRDYETWELTAGGGDLHGITVERITLRSGDGNGVKLLPGQGKVLSGATVRDVSGAPDNSAVVVFHDTVQPSTMNGTIRDLVIEGISGTPSVNGFLVNVAHPNVENITIRNVMVSGNASPRAIAFSTPGGVAKRVIIDGLTTTIAYTGTLVHVASNYSVRDMKVSNVSAQGGAGIGPVVQVSGTVDNFQGVNIGQSGGRSVVNIDGAGQAPLISINGMASTATYGVFVNNAAATVECHLSGVTVLPTSRLVFVNAGAAFLRGSGLVSATSHIGKSVGATIRATGADVRVDVSTLSPQSGDVVGNTALTHVPVGPVVSNGDGSWTSLQTGAKTTASVGFDFPSIPAGGQADLTTTAATVVPGDTVRLSPPSNLPAGLMWAGWVSAANTITFRLFNLTGAAINPDPGTWRFAVSKT